MGRYRLGQQIGEGATGAIFDGEFGPLRRPVAIKILHEHLVGDSSARRMLAEARMLSRLDHPGIVKVFDVGEVQGRAFIVMERLAGESLWSRIARQQLSEERIVSFARQLASALEAAHALGIVHRDLKPENVFIVRDPDVPGGERVKLIDFGIAKQEWEHGERTATGVVLGTPTYMAPEQWDREVDPRADIYSLGVVIYVMATCELPFIGNTNELLAEHAYCAPPRAAERGFVSSWLSSIIDRCLAKRPKDRFPTMAALASALRALEQAIAPPLTGEMPRFDEDDAEEELTTPGPRALGTCSDDALTTVVPLAIGTARNPRLSTRSIQEPRMRGRRSHWLVALYIVVLAALAITPVAVIPPLYAPVPGAEEPAPTIKRRYMHKSVDAPAKGDADPAEPRRRPPGQRRALTNR
jgi:serine/threonine protein kinase